MKILIIGNIGTGKTTIGEKIQEILDYKIVQIDKLREKYLNYAVSGEYYCLYKFLKEIEGNKDIILEFTGAGCHKFAIKRALELTKDSVIVILCKTRELTLIIERFKKKEFKYRNVFEIDFDKHINFIEKELENDVLSGFWDDPPYFTFVNVYMNTLEDLNKNLDKLKDLFNN